MVEYVAIERLPSWVQMSLRKFAPALRKHMLAAAHRGRTAILATIARVLPHPPVDRGTYRASWAAEETKTGAVIYSDAPHAVFIELGARPHWPPLAPIEAWVRRKRIARGEDAKGVAFVIARAIAKRGMAPRRVVEKSMPEIMRILEDEIQQGLAEATGR